MISMVKIGVYESYLLERKTKELSKPCFAMRLRSDDSQMVMLEGKEVNGRDDDKHAIMGYIKSVCVPKVVDLLDEVDGIDSALDMLCHFDFESWSRFNQRLGMNDSPVEAWHQLVVRLIIDATSYRDVQLSLVTDDFVSKLSADLRDRKVSGDMLHRRLVPVYLSNPNITHEEAIKLSEEIKHPDSYILSQSRTEWESMQSRYAHLN